jgi:hypothetical protein
VTAAAGGFKLRRAVHPPLAGPLAAAHRDDSDEPRWFMMMPADVPIDVSEEPPTRSWQAVTPNVSGTPPGVSVVLEFVQRQVSLAREVGARASRNVGEKFVGEHERREKFVGAREKCDCA